MLEGIKSITAGIKELFGIGSTKKTEKTSSNTASSGVMPKSNENELVDVQIQGGSLSDADNSKQKVTDTIDQKIASGQMYKNNSLFKAGDYIYVADGKETYSDIKEALGLPDGALRYDNSSLFDKINGNADDVVPEEGTEIKIDAKDLPSKSVSFTSDDGEELTGFSKDYNGNLFYTVQSGDTQISIYEKLGNDCFNLYKTSNILEGYPQETLQSGTKISIYEKRGLSRLFAKLFG